MSLTAYRADTGEVIEAFSVSDEAWSAIRQSPLGTYRMRGDAPAIPKQNMYGTRWFQSMPGNRDPNWKPESAAHEMAKLWMVQALRQAGIEACVEKHGTTPDGEAWEADVWLTTGARTIAIEVQISLQSFEEYQLRSDRYARSGVKVIWLINRRHYKAFSLPAVRHKGWVPGGPPVLPDMVEIPAFPLELRFPLNRPEIDKLHVLVQPHGAHTYFPILVGDFATGVAQGALRFRDRTHWAWHAIA